MAQYWRGNPNQTQKRGFRCVKAATMEERLASMERELACRIQSFGPNDWFVTTQIQAINRLKEEMHNERPSDSR
jgi:hypothetical protein